MTKYAAMLRGIGPTNPNMRGEKLCEVFTSLGFANVQSVITSGNVLFESDIADTAKLEAMVEAALPRQLSFSSTTFIRSQAELQALVDADPFPGVEQGPQHYITMTFLKTQPQDGPTLPYRPANGGYEVLALYDRAISATLDQTREKTPNLMAWLEKNYGKNITTRTWKTVNKLLDKLNEA
ncbi:MAG TPA: DUF1697 domain-containing protein [Candidatus Saccharimonadales bacterium]|nr:DUF1697 domain-containing protein [Candidatus Saccharimonadales bacterium]